MCSQACCSVFYFRRSSEYKKRPTTQKTTFGRSKNLSRLLLPFVVILIILMDLASKKIVLVFWLCNR